jgi:CspA family cold shock protein
VAGGVVSAGQRVAFLVVEGERGLQAEHVLPLGAGAGQPAAADGADGTVSWFDEGKGFGFITPDSGGDDVFVHVRALAEGLTWLTEGDRVTYEVVQGDKGPQAGTCTSCTAPVRPSPRRPHPPGLGTRGRATPLRAPARAWSRGTTPTAASASSPRTRAAPTCSCTCRS